MCLESFGQIEIMDEYLRPLRFMKGKTVFLPVKIGRCMVTGDATVLKSRC